MAFRRRIVLFLVFILLSGAAYAEKLASLAPGKGTKKVYFGNSGAEAVEAAFKLARWHTQRELNIAFYGAFHGRTMGALSLTASKTIQKKHYNPLVPGITHIPYAYCYRCAYNLCYPDCGLFCVRWVEDTLFRTTIPPEEVAAIIVEPTTNTCLTIYRARRRYLKACFTSPSSTRQQPHVGYHEDRQAY